MAAFRNSLVLLRRRLAKAESTSAGRVRSSFAFLLPLFSSSFGCPFILFSVTDPPEPCGTLRTPFLILFRNSYGWSIVFSTGRDVGAGLGGSPFGTFLYSCSPWLSGRPVALSGLFQSYCREVQSRGQHWSTTNSSPTPACVCYSSRRRRCF